VLVGERVGVSGRVEDDSLLLTVVLFDRSVRFGGPVEDQGHRLRGEIAALDEPLVGLFGEQGAGEADRGGVVGRDADDVRSPADLLVDAFQRIGRAQLGLVL
jgi:hypothetical protein